MPERFLAGGGEMGEKIRAFDWSKTSLGPLETWPASLRTTAGLILNSDFPHYLLWGPDLIGLYNDAYRPILGAKPEILGVPFREAWAEAWDDVKPLVEQALSGRAVFVENLRLTLRRYGAEEEAYFTFCYSPVRGEDDEVVGLLDTVIETTATVLAERNLRQAQEELRLANEQLEQRVAETVRQRDRVWRNSRDLMVVIRADGTFRAVSPSWTEVLGHEPDEVVGRSFLEFVHPEDAAAAEGGLESAARAGQLTSFENRHLHKDGSARWISWHTSVEGGTVYAYGRDITRDKQRDEVLALERARLRTIFDTTSQLMGFLETDGTVIVGNRAALDAIEGRLEDVAGRKFWDTPWFTGTPGLPAFVREAVQRAAKGESLRAGLSLTLPDGSLRDYDFGLQPVKDAGGRVVQLVPEAFDVTEQRQVEEQLRQAQKMEAVGQLTGGIAHDFNNLLTIIRSSADFLRRRDLSEQRRERYVEAIVDTADRAAKLTSQLLAFARRQPLQPELFEVGECVRDVAEMVRPLVGSRIRIEVSAPDTPCYVEADRAQFETALVNLAVNARDAMNGEGRLAIEVGRADRLPAIRGHGGGPGDFVVVSVADTGGGIPPALLDRIFEPFFTTKEVGKGTGLGLSQVFGFAKQSGGEVTVKSEPGQGASFSLYLQRRSDGPAEDAAEAETTAQASGRTASVLLVEDNEAVGGFAAQMLQDLGYATTWAASGPEALERLRAEELNFDVVISDVVMPGMSGIEFARTLRELYPGLPVVLTSGYSHVLAEEGPHGFEFLRKPYSIESLARLLRKVVNERRTPATAATAPLP